MIDISCQDNLVLLNKLPSNFFDLIYCDILYGSGRRFTHYQDLRPIRDDIEHHYMPRIENLWRVLKSTGTLYLHMDSKISHWVRCITENIFGYENMRNEIIWHYNSAPRRKFDFGSRHDTIYRFSKSDTYKFHAIREPYSLSAPRGYAKEKYYHPEGKVIGDVWQINALGQNDRSERTGYDTQKPERLLERIITVSSDVGDLVGDFYLGSGTTAVVCKRLNRNFIGCDISAEAIRITRERLDKCN